MAAPDVVVDTRRRWLWLALAAIVPAAILFWGNAMFTWSHFLEGPFLQDAGWYSAIIYRRGFFPENPPVLKMPHEYYSIHVSLAVSLTSLLSYVYPGERVDWYCLFQGTIYAPLGALTALLVGRGPGRATLRDAAMVAAAALAFALNGQAFACMGYPHYEIIVPIGVCIMLAALARGKTKLAWVGLAVAASAREDGGFHACSLLIAVAACGVWKRPFPVPLRRILTMAGTALALSVFAFVVQRLFFKSTGLLRHEYLGDPAFAHLDGASLVRRLAGFIEHAKFIALPLLATVVLAVATRDPRYLLGWIVELPWLLLNFLAAQELKSRFEIYTGFPFVASIFWVGVYALVKGEPRRRTLAFLGAISLTSTVGAAWSWTEEFTFLYSRAAWPIAIPHREIRSFTRTLRKNPHAYGPLFVDLEVAAWTIETVPLEFRLWEDGRRWPDEDRLTRAFFEPVEGFAFFRKGAMKDIIYDFLAASPFRRCGAIRGTEVFFCTREGHALPPEFEDRSPIVGALMQGEGVRRTAEGYELSPGKKSGDLRLWGPFTRLSPGRYEATWDVTWRECAPGTGPRLEADVFLPFRSIAQVEVMQLGEPIRMTFELPGPTPTENVELRTTAGRCAVLVRGIQVVRLY